MQVSRLVQAKEAQPGTVLSLMALNRSFTHATYFTTMVEVVSLISAVLTLLDFGCKVVSGTRSVRDSLHGSAPDVHELSLILRQVETSHQTYMSTGKKSMHDDKNV